MLPNDAEFPLGFKTALESDEKGWSSHLKRVWYCHLFNPQAETLRKKWRDSRGDHLFRSTSYLNNVAHIHASSCLPSLWIINLMLEKERKLEWELISNHTAFSGTYQRYNTEWKQSCPSHNGGIIAWSYHGGELQVRLGFPVSSN